MVKVDVQSNETLDQEEVSLLLIGNDAEQNQAIELIHDRLGKALVGAIRRQAPGLSTDDVMEIYQESLLGILNAARESRFDADAPLLPFIFAVARYKTIDRLRKRLPANIGDDALLDALAEVQGGEEGAPWRNAVAKEQGDKLMRLVRRTIAELPLRQRQVAQVIIQRFPEEPSVTDIAAAVKQATGETVTIVAVKSALREFRKKMRDRVKEWGFVEEDHER